MTNRRERRAQRRSRGRPTTQPRGRTGSRLLVLVAVVGLLLLAVASVGLVGMPPTASPIP